MGDGVMGDGVMGDGVIGILYVNGWVFRGGGGGGGEGARTWGFCTGESDEGSFDLYLFTLYECFFTCFFQYLSNLCILQMSSLFE